MPSKQQTAREYFRLKQQELRDRRKRDGFVEYKVWIPAAHRDRIVAMIRKYLEANVT